MMPLIFIACFILSLVRMVQFYMAGYILIGCAFAFSMFVGFFGVVLCARDNDNI